MTQADISRSLEVSKPTVSIWESGDAVPSQRLESLAKLFGVEVSEMVERSVAMDTFGTPQPLSGEAVSQTLLNHDPDTSLECSIAVEDVAKEFAVHESVVLELASLSSNKEVRRIAALATPGKTVTDRMEKIRWNEALFLEPMSFKLKGVVTSLGVNFDSSIGLVACSKDDVLEWTGLTTVDDVWDDLLACDLVERYGTAEWVFRLKFPEST